MKDKEAVKKARIKRRKNARENLLDSYIKAQIRDVSLRDDPIEIDRVRTVIAEKRKNRGVPLKNRDSYTAKLLLRHDGACDKEDVNRFRRYLDLTRNLNKIKKMMMDTYQEFLEWRGAPLNCEGFAARRITKRQDGDNIWCPRCRTYKERNKFKTDSSRSCGKCSCCRECGNKIRKTNREKRREYESNHKYVHGKQHADEANNEG